MKKYKIINITYIYTYQCYIAKYNICSQEIRREPVGATSKKISTKSLWGHLKSKHKNEHSLTEKERSKETEKRENFKKARRKILIFLYFV